MMRASVFGWPRSVSRRGGNPPAPAFPRRGKRERGRPKFLAAAGHFRRAEIGPRGLGILVFLQRFNAAWMRSPHSI